jgi:hypothetical protein
MDNEPDDYDPFSNIDDFFLPDVTKYPDTPDGLLAKELKKWKEEEHQRLMDELKDEEDNEYPLIED